MSIPQSLQQDTYMHPLTRIQHRTLQSPEQATHYTHTAAHPELAHVTPQFDRHVRLPEHKPQPLNLHVRNHGRF